MARARLLPVSGRESSAWLHALPITSLGLRMDDMQRHQSHGWRSFRVYFVSSQYPPASSGSCYPSCTIIHTGPTRVEPSGLLCSDGKRPDGVTMIPCSNGKFLVYDATFPGTLAQSYCGNATSSAGAVAIMVGERKLAKYISLDRSHSFTPVTIETLGVIEPKSMAFLKDLSWRIWQWTGEEKLTCTSCSDSLWLHREGMLTLCL